MMGDFTKQMSLLKTTIDNLSKERNQVRVNFITAEVKTILTKKWLDLMINALTKMRANKNYDDDLLEDLKTIVKRIP